jgi:hypothetical protein
LIAKFKAILVNSFNLPIKNTELFYQVKNEYLYLRSELIDELKLDKLVNDEELIGIIKNKFIYENETDHFSPETLLLRRRLANVAIAELLETRRQYLQVSLLHGDLYLLAVDLLKKQDYKNAKIALAIAYTHTLFNPGQCFVVSKEEFEFQMNLLPLFVKKFYLKRDFSAPLPEQHYEEIKKKLLELLDQK